MLHVRSECVCLFWPNIQLPYNNSSEGTKLNTALETGRILLSELQFNVHQWLCGASPWNRVIIQQCIGSKPCDDVHLCDFASLADGVIVFLHGVGEHPLQADRLQRSSDPPEPLNVTSCLLHRRQLRCVFKGQLPGPTVQVLDML